MSQGEGEKRIRETSFYIAIANDWDKWPYSYMCLCVIPFLKWIYILFKKIIIITHTHKCYGIVSSEKETIWALACPCDFSTVNIYLKWLPGLKWTRRRDTEDLQQPSELYYRFLYIYNPHTHTHSIYKYMHSLKVYIVGKKWGTRLFGFRLIKCHIAEWRRAFQ